MAREGCKKRAREEERIQKNMDETKRLLSESKEQMSMLKNNIKYMGLLGEYRLRKTVDKTRKNLNEASGNLVSVIERIISHHHADWQLNLASFQKLPPDTKKEYIQRKATELEERLDAYKRSNLRIDQMKKSFNLLLQKKINELQKTVEDKQVERLANENDVLKLKVDALNKKLKEKEIELEELKARNQSLNVNEQTYSDEEELEVSGYEFFVPKLELDALNKKLEEKERELEELKARNQSLIVNEQTYKDEAEHQVSTSEFFVPKRDLEALNKKLEEKERELEELKARNQSLIVNEQTYSDEEELEVYEFFVPKVDVDALNKKLEEKERELEELKARNRSLIVKEQTSNDELQEAREVLMMIHGVGETSKRSAIGVKRTGDLDLKTFRDAGVDRHILKGCDKIRRSTQLCSLWEERIKDPSWHPFEIVKVGNEEKKKIDEEDEKLKNLKDELGEEVYKAVTTALMKWDQLNSSGRQPVEELWNFKEGRRATLTEGLIFLLHRLKPQLHR